MSQTGQYFFAGGGGGPVTQVTTDAGVALPVAGDINALGGPNINTTGVGNTVTINLDNDVVTNSYATTGPAQTLTITDSTITSGGTNPDVDISFITQGGGDLSFRGLAGGYTSSEWKTGQAAVQTNDATPTLVVGQVVAAGEMVSIKAYVNGFRDTFADAIGAEVFVTAYRPAAGNVTLIGAPVINSNTTSTSDVTAVVDIGTQQLRILVTGVAAQTFNWVVSYNYFYTITNA